MDSQLYTHTLWLRT